MEDRKVPAQVCTTAVDMMIIVDGTGSVGSSNFDLEKLAIQDLAGSFAISPAETHVGIVQLGGPIPSSSGFGPETKLDLPLSSDAATINATAAGLVYQSSGSTALGTALQVAQQDLATNGRPGIATPVIVLMTDGQSNAGPDPNTVATQVKADGTIIYTLGVGTGVNEAQLKSIASDPNTGYFPASSFNDLAPVIAQVATTTCTQTSSPPVAIPKGYTVAMNTPLTVAAPGVLAGTTDSNPMHTTFTAVLITPPTHGQLTLNADGSFKYVPDPGFSGQDRFAFAANDGVDTGTTAAATITVQAGPQITKLQRFGFHRQTTQIVLTYNEPMDPSSVQDTANYAILTGPAYHFQVIHILSAQYNAANQTVTLIPDQLLILHARYTLMVNGMSPSGVMSETGILLDGAGNGTPGTNYTKNFGIESWVRPTPMLLPSRVFRTIAGRPARAMLHGPLGLATARRRH